MPAFTMPQLGESDVEGTVVKWLKQPGEHVHAEEPLVEVETEKVNVEIPSPFEGVLTEILVPEGETVPVGAELAVIGERTQAGVPVPSHDGAQRGESSAAAAEARDTAPELAPERAELMKDEPARFSVAAQAVEEPAGVNRSSLAAEPNTAMVDRVTGPSGNGHTVAPAGEPGPGRYTPAVLRLAAEHGIDLKAVPGTGMNGRVTRKDVQQYIERGAPERGTRSAERGTETVALTTGVEAQSPEPILTSKPEASSSGEPVLVPRSALRAPRSDEEVIKPSPTRLTIARNMVRAAAIPTAWMAVETDVTGLVRLRERVREEFRRREGVDLSYLPFIIVAVVEALKEYPLLNSEWRDEQIVVKKRINMGIAVGSDEGLVVPVIHDADRLSIAGLAHAIVDLAERARARRLRLEDVQGGTFTLDNTGVFGSVVSRPIINPPQCAILTTEAILKRPVIVEDAIAIRSLMNLCISFDHRIVDGSHVGPFMQAIKRRLERFGPDTPLS